jgi:hypothetical protein
MRANSCFFLRAYGKFYLQLRSWSYSFAVWLSHKFDKFFKFVKFNSAIGPRVMSPGYRTNLTNFTPLSASNLHRQT